MGRLSLLLAALIILLAAHSSHGCKAGIRAGIKAAVKVGAKSTGRALARGGRMVGRGGKFIGKAVVKGVRKAPGVIVKGVKKAPGQIGKYIKKNPFTVANFVTSVGTCIAASQISGRDNCRGTCQRIQREIEASNSSIIETMKKMEIGVNKIKALQTETTRLIQISQNISIYFNKLGDIVNETITENARTMGISDMVEAAFNSSRIDELAQEDQTLALANGLVMLTQKIGEQHRVLGTVDNVLALGGLGFAVSGLAINFGAQKYAMRQALKVNDGIKYMASKNAIKKVLAGKSHYDMVYPDLVRSKKGLGAMNTWRRGKKIAKVINKVGNVITLAGTAICATQIGLQLKSEGDVLAIQRNTSTTLKKLDTDLRSTSAEIDSMLTNVTVETNSEIKNINQEYESLFSFAAKSLCSSTLNSNSSECEHFSEHGCHLSLNNNISTFSNDMEYLNEAIRNTYNYFAEITEHKKTKQDQKDRARIQIELYKKEKIGAPTACTLLQSILRESADDVCDTLYTSGLYPGLGLWSPWIDGACSHTDCRMIQRRTCTPGPACIGSNQRTVPCSTPCVTQQGQSMDAAFAREMITHC